MTADRREQIIDELLVARCRAGSSDAFRKLVARWQERLYHHALRLTGRDDAAWDVVQESWMVVTRRIDQILDPGSFRRWIYTIVTRKAADCQRRRGRRERHEAPTAVDLADLSPVKPSSATELLREAFKLLSGERQAILSLRYVDGFEVLELAEILGIPEGTMKSKLFHARAKLREIIERIDQ